MSDGVREAYTEGRGSVIVRGKMHIEDGSNATGPKKARSSLSPRPAVVITEMPYLTNKASMRLSGWLQQLIGRSSFIFIQDSIFIRVANVRQRVFLH